MTGYHDSFIVEIHGRARVISASLENILFRYLNDALWREMGQSGCLKRSKLGGKKSNSLKTERRYKMNLVL